MKLSVQPPMTQTHDSLTELEAQFADHLELSPEAQDLLFRDARTANTFTDEPVTEEQVRAIYDLVKWAPTSMNNQPLRIVLVRTPEARGRLVELMGGNNKAEDLDRAAGGRPRRRRRLPRRARQGLPDLPGRPRPLRRQRRASVAPRPRSTPPSRSPTSSSASARRAWPPAR